MNYDINDSRMAAIADAIREKLGVATKYTVAQMPAAIRSIIGGGTATLISKNIVANGSYAAVNDNADGYSSVVVTVPSAAPNLQSKTITENGTVTPDSGYDGLSSVAVDVGAKVGNCLHGSSYPASDLGNNGDLYIRTTNLYRYFRMTIPKVRNSGSGCQLSKICLGIYGYEIWEEEEPVVTYSYYPQGSSIWHNNGSDASSVLTEVYNLMDCHTETKYATAKNPTAQSPIIITIEMGGGGLSGTEEISWNTSEDGSTDCDPVSFSFELSADGTNWIPAGSYTDYNVTINRGSYAIDTHLTAPTNNTFVRGVYIKESGTWKEIDGSSYS